MSANEGTLPLPTKGQAVKALMPTLSHTIRLPLLLILVAVVFLAVVSLRPSRAMPPDERIAPMPGVVIGCHPAPCLAPERMITAAQAWNLKRTLGDEMLLVDIRGRAEAYFTGIPQGVDAQVPFAEPRPDFAWNAAAQEPEMDFRTDFAANLDEALRVRRLKHDARVVLMCRSGERALVAALLLQEHGFTNVYVVRDGFEGRIARRADGNEVRSDGGWKNAGLPWSSRVYARWEQTGQTQRQ